MSHRDRTRIALLAGTLLLAPPALAQEDVPPPKVKVYTGTDGQPFARVTERIIGFNDPAMNEESFLASADGRRVAYFVMAGEGLAVVIDGVRGEVFEGIADRSLTFSPDGKHFGYIATRPGSQFVILDGQVHEYRGVSQKGIVFAPDSSHYGWVGIRDDHQFAVIDGVEGPPFEGVAPQGILFSTEGGHHAYAAKTGNQAVVILDGAEGELFETVVGLGFTARGHHARYVGVRGNERFAVIDTTSYGPFDEIRAITSKVNEANPMPEVFEVSADGTSIGFIASRGEEWFVLANGKQFGPYQGCTGLSLSPEGSRVTFLATRGDGWFMVVDGEEQTSHSFQSLSFSPDGQRLASVIKRDNRFRALIDGAEGKDYDRIEPPGIRFSADGKHTAYLAVDGTDRVAVVDGTEGPRFRRLGSIPLGFVPNSSRPMYSIRKGENETFVIDGVEGPPFQVQTERGALPAGIKGLTFTADGSRYAYAGMRSPDAWVVIVDGEAYGPGGKLAPGDEAAYHSVGKRTPVFSPDGKKAAWVAVRDTGWVAVVEGKESRPYSLVMRSTLDFSPDSQHIAYVASRDGKKLIIVDDQEIDGEWDGFLQKSDFVWEGPRTFSIRGTRNPQYLLIEVEIL